MADQDIEFNQLDIAPSLDDLAVLVGTVDNGDGTYTDYRFTPAQTAAYVLQKNNKMITALSANITTTNYNNDTLLDDFFNANDVQEVATNGGSLLRGSDFNWTSGGIVLINQGQWLNGQLLRAKK